MTSTVINVHKQMAKQHKDALARKDLKEALDRLKIYKKKAKLYDKAQKAREKKK